MPDLYVGVLIGEGYVVKSRALQPGQLGLSPESAVEQLGNLIRGASLYLCSAAECQCGSTTSGSPALSAKSLMAMSSLEPQDGIITFTVGERLPLRRCPGEHAKDTKIIM